MKLLFLLCLMAQAPGPDSLETRVERLHDSIVSIDTHNDFAMSAFPVKHHRQGQVSLN